MLFNSLHFAVFFPIVFALHWTIPSKYRYVLLLVASYYFYMSWNAKYVVLILFTTGITYFAGLAMEKTINPKKKKFILAVTLIACLGTLFLFKYFNFFTEFLSLIANKIGISLHPITLKFLLPVGISFYTFQTLSYVIDVYQGSISAERNLGIYATFISFFPQLVAGPIERSSNLLPQLKSPRTFSYEQAMEGVRQVIWGFFKKIAIADTVAVYVDQVYSNPMNYYGFDLAIVILFFTVQIYCDFSGYSDIAIGSSKLLGINLMTNFRSPYFSASVQEFWSRWHISLSQWFRDYVYIPLGGNRCSRLRQYRNRLITFLASGLWHGANWTFVLWGAFHGILQIIEGLMNTSLSKIKEHRIGKLLCVIIVFALCNIGWVLFRADSLTDAICIIAHFLDGISNPAAYLHSNIGLSKKKLLVIIGRIGIVAIFDYFDRDGKGFEQFLLLPKWVRLAIAYGLIIASVFAAVSSSAATQFVYFQF